jgi:hypothetical protein
MKNAAANPYSLTWTQADEATWTGRCAATRYAREITFASGWYLVEGASYAYRTLTAAKIAAARTQVSWVSESQRYA